MVEANLNAGRSVAIWVLGLVGTGIVSALIADRLYPLGWDQMHAARWPSWLGYASLPALGLSLGASGRIEDLVMIETIAHNVNPASGVQDIQFVARARTVWPLTNSDRPACIRYPGQANVLDRCAHPVPLGDVTAVEMNDQSDLDIWKTSLSEDCYPAV